jgi:hypothetical protein
MSRRLGYALAVYGALLFGALMAAHIAACM